MKLVLNALPMQVDLSASVRVGTLPYEDDEQIESLRNEYGQNYVIRRHGNVVEVATSDKTSSVPGQVVDKKVRNIAYLLGLRLSEWLSEHFSTTKRQLFHRRRSLIIVSDRPEDNLLNAVVPKGVSIPAGIALRTVFELEVRVECNNGKFDVFVFINSRSRPQIDISVADLVALGVSIDGFYVRRKGSNKDTRFADAGRLTGRVIGRQSGELELADYEDGWPSIQAEDAKLEPRMEVLAHVLSSLAPSLGAKHEVLEHLRRESGRISTGAEQLKRIQSLANYLKRFSPVLLDGVSGSFGDLITSNNVFPKYEKAEKPALIFDVRRTRTNRWNQGGLDQHGPYDRYQFSPKKLNIAVICRQDLQGRVESFVGQLLNGIQNTKGGDVGFLRRFALDKPYVQVFTTSDDFATSYRKASIAAIEHITDKGQSWNLVLVQTEQAMESMVGDDNPYLVTRAFFLGKGVAIQHVHFDTITQPPQQRVYSLNNLGLACYAKLGGVPWLLPSDQTVAHELVIGLGSHHERTSRFGSGDRFVGITTVFSGDGQYLLESRTRAVAFDDYGAAMLEAVRTAVTKVREEQAWVIDDPVRLVFHVFKPVKNIEVEAVRTLMEELSLPHVEYAFLHVAGMHPYQVFDEDQRGAPAGLGKIKGALAAPRGLIVYLSDRDVLLNLKGSKELKQAADGHPSPLLLHLHKASTFRDLTYLCRQAFAFSCHSWRSFLPAPTPITILYSQLVAESLRDLESVSGWSDDAIVGRIGRTRWFL